MPNTDSKFDIYIYLWKNNDLQEIAPPRKFWVYFVCPILIFGIEVRVKYFVNRCKITNTRKFFWIQIQCNQFNLTQIHVLLDLLLPPWIWAVEIHNVENVQRNNSKNKKIYENKVQGDLAQPTLCPKIGPYLMCGWIQSPAHLESNLLYSSIQGTGIQEDSLQSSYMVQPL